MPAPYVKKLSQKHGMSTQKGEEKWDDAKDAADKQGQGKNYAYRTAIFKKMMHEKSALDVARERITARLKDL